jgi:hypothetical protein
MPEHKYRSYYESPRRYVCRVWNCHERGFGHYCKEHTPDRGVGILLCLNCGKPTSEHSMGKLCWQGGEPKGDTHAS